jgi:hypothetical protein
VWKNEGTPKKVPATVMALSPPETGSGWKFTFIFNHVIRWHPEL